MEDKSITGYPHLDKPWLKFYKNQNYNKEYFNMNLTQYLKEKNKNRNLNIASTYYGKKMNYNDFFSKVDIASKVLTELGVKKADRIICLLPNIPEAGEIWLGATQIGAITDFIDPRPDSMDIQANAKKVLELIKYEKSKFIVALDKCYLAMLKPIEKELKELGIKEIITVSATDSMNVLGKIDYLNDVLQYNKIHNEKCVDSTIRKLKGYQVLLEKINAMLKEEQHYKSSIKSSLLNVVKYSELVNNSKYITFSNVYEKDLINYIGHTSGTSGSRPKPICLTNENHISSSEQLFMAGANFKPNDKILHELPFFSPLGADNNWILNLASGSNNIDIPEFEINEFGYLIKKYHPNVILGTPSWLASLLTCNYLDNEDLSCINRIIYGGDSMEAAEEEKLNIWLKEHGSNALVEKGHGMSEYCGCGSYAKGIYNKYNSIGIPLPKTIYSIVDPEVKDFLKPVKFNKTEDYLKGELVVSSQAVTSGKLDNDIIVPHYKMDGIDFIRTRDLVYMDKDGIFYFESRKDRSFTRFDGYKVKPYEIEKEIEKNSNIKCCRIVQYYDNEKRGFMPIAHIVLNDKEINIDNYVSVVKDIINNQIIGNNNMSSRQIPSKFKIRKNLPLTKNSKIDFNSLINEGIDGTEISVIIDETNLSVGKINIKAPNMDNKIKILKK